MMKLPHLLLLVLLCPSLACAQGEGFAINGSVKIYYRTFGEGQPLLIINGGPGLKSDGYVELAQRLAGSGFNTIIYDQRGTGRSDIGSPDSSNITMALMAEDIECLRKQLRIESWSILGQSFGGMMAAFYTAEHPERVRSLIFSASGGLDLDLLRDSGAYAFHRLSQVNRDSLFYWDQRLLAGDTSYAVTLGRARMWAPAYTQDQKNLPAVIERLAQVNYPVQELVWLDLQRMRFDCKEKLATFQKPVLIIQGEDDIFPKRIAATAQRVFTNSRLVFLTRCGHLGWLDRPDAYFPAIEDFLRGL